MAEIGLRTDPNLTAMVYKYNSGIDALELGRRVIPGRIISRKLPGGAVKVKKGRTGQYPDIFLLVHGQGLDFNWLALGLPYLWQAIHLKFFGFGVKAIKTIHAVKPQPAL